MTSTSVPSTPTNATAPTFETTRFIHKFGYHLAKQLLGPSTVNNCLKVANESLQNIDGRQKNQTHTFRANWRGPSTKFPWMLGQSQPKNDSCNVDDGKVTPDSLFVDVTFDFLVFPYEVTEEGRTSFCHVVKSEEWEQDDDDYDKDKKNPSPRLVSSEERRFVSLSVAIRLGTLIAIPDNKERIDGNEKKYRYYYQRGNPLTGPDVYEHCRSIDIVPEEMDATQIADIIGKALSNDDGRVMIESNDENAAADVAAPICTSPLSQSLDITNDSPKKKWYWKLELHHQELEGKGTLPLKTYDHAHVFSKAYDDQNWGTPIDHSILDTFLLNNQGQRCVSIPTAEAKLVWNQFDPTLLESLKEPVKPSPRKPVPVVNPYAKKPSPPKAEVENKSSDGNSKPKIRKASPMKRETALFAKGKRTTIAGQRRKKPKFTIGPK